MVQEHGGRHWPVTLLGTRGELHSSVAVDKKENLEC